MIDSKQIKSIKGTIEGGNWVHRVLFYSDDLAQDQNLVGKIQVNSDAGLSPPQVLREGEEIIGVYGTKNVGETLRSLGLIVWTPNKL